MTGNKPARTEIPEGNCEPLDIPKGSLEDENDYIEDENPFRNAGPLQHP